MEWKPRLKGKRRLAVIGASLTLGALSLVAIASASEVVTSEVTATTNDVTVTQGSSTNSTINVTATGSTACTITSANPSTATVDTSYALSSSGTVTAGTPSAAMSFYSNGVPTGGPNCGTTWNDAPTPYSVTASFSAAPTTPVGNYNVTLVTAETNPDVTGGKLGDATATTVTVHVIAPTVTDTTPPVITPNVSGTLGDNGWYTSNVTVSWTVTDPDSSISSSSGCGGTTSISTDTAGTTVGPCTATSAGGTSSQSVTIKRDATAPTISGSAAPPANGNGWNKTDVDVTFACDDPLSNGVASGIASCGPTNPVTLSSQGSGQSASGTAKDSAGNTAQTTVSDINIDKTAPLVSVTGVSNTTYIRGSVPAAGCQTEDQVGLSGVQTPASLEPLSGSGTTNPNGVGSFTATCSGGTDNADNPQAAASVTYSVIYDPAGISGILQPINPDGTSLFSRGKAVPVKFRLAGDEPNGFVYSGWTLQRIKVSCTDFDSEDAAIEAATENPSNAFRYDAGADQYIHNASFKDQAAGTCWKVRVTLDSNQTMESAVFKLQK